MRDTRMRDQRVLLATQRVGVRREYNPPRAYIEYALVYLRPSAMRVHLRDFEMGKLRERERERERERTWNNVLFYFCHAHRARWCFFFAHSYSERIY